MRVPLRRIAQVGAIALSLVACASEPPDPRVEAGRLRVQASAGVSKIQHALESPAIPSRELGEGVQLVEDAARGLGELEDDPRVSTSQRIGLVLDQARSWESASDAIRNAALLEALDAEQRAALLPVLREKAFPSDVAASSAYRRALMLACESSAHETAREIVAELARRGERIDGASSCP
ncbi:MAG: hypothetical protein HYV07_28490 [Deltaproteobacteria bacterium]|nr:hypothetical protein [Deltaproteobacteria bacterium]